MTVELRVKIVDESYYNHLFVDGEHIAAFDRFAGQWAVLSHCDKCVGQWLDRRDVDDLEKEKRHYGIMVQLLKQLDQRTF